MVGNNGRIVLINPRSLHAWECLGLGYLASYSYNFGYHPEQYGFFAGEFDSDEEIIAGCEHADIVGFSLTSFQVKHGLSLVRGIKKINSRAKIVWGGYAVSGLTEPQLLEMFGYYVDYFVQGPGEESWVEILSTPNAPRVIRKPLISDLNQIPFPDRDLIRIDRNFDKLRERGEQRKTSMELQRGGCPFGCIFCAAGSFTRTHGQSRTAENVVDEMLVLQKKYGMDKDSMVLMCDAEIFMTPEMRKMADLKIQRGIEMKFGMNVVASTILHSQGRRILEKMVEAGCTEVWMGVESDPTLMHLTGKPIKPDQVREAFRITKEMGLIRKAYFILGFTPEETEQTILNRIPFIEELDPDVVGFTIYVPVPGSPGYKHELHKDIDYANSDEYYNTYTRTRTLSNEDLQHWQQYLVQYFKGRITYRQQNNETNAVTMLKGRPGRSGY
ncbi:MAG: B12-binding domain-containing radical SAM protein [Chloroflexi bacterium]|nr:B12-binding domain-containing radical SAM protein [Chloroflexota bacterium]